MTQHNPIPGSEYTMEPDSSGARVIPEFTSPRRGGGCGFKSREVASGIAANMARGFNTPCLVVQQGRQYYWVRLPFVDVSAEAVKHALSYVGCVILEEFDSTGTQVVRKP